MLTAGSIYNADQSVTLNDAGESMLTRSTVLLIGALAAGTALAATGETSFTYKLVLFLHQALFVFWLGPDIGVYLWSRKLTNTEITPAQRVAAGRIMPVIGVISLACMSLMLTIGGILTEIRGIPHPWWQMAGIVLLGPVWLTLTLLVFFRAGSAAGEQLAKLDIAFRWLVMIAVLVSVAIALGDGRLDGVPWVTAKLVMFAVLVSFGIIVRSRLTILAGAVDQLEASGPNPELDNVMAAAAGRARVFMIASWIVLGMAAAMGTFQPGSADNTMSLENPLQTLD